MKTKPSDMPEGFEQLFGTLTKPEKLTPEQELGKALLKIRKTNGS